jgi:hypothetical protein
MSAIPNGPNKKAIVTEQVGLTDITISYHRPGLNGREGKIWGQLIAEGFTNMGLSPNPSPWRAGANENTIFESSNDIKVEGAALPKGKYALFIAYYPKESILIFSKKYDAWGSFFYDEKEDALRVKVKPYALDKSVEWLRYEFTQQTSGSAIIALEWEQLAIPFKVEVDYLQQQYDAICSELKNPRGFTYQSLTSAAQWCVDNNYKVEQALVWTNLATDSLNGYGGHHSFSALSTKAQVLEKLGKSNEAFAIMKLAMPYGEMMDLHQYARQLLGEKRLKEALAIFEANYKKHPEEFTTQVGMARGLAATSDYKKALALAQKALKNAPNAPNKTSVEGMIEKLKMEKDIN